MKKNISCALVFTFLLSLTGCGTQQAKVGDNYYLDSENGQDTNDGLSPDQAWKTFDKVKNSIFKAGDSILLRRESIYNGVMEISAHGKPDVRIVIGAYGLGNAPRIIAPDSSMYAVLIKKSDYLTLRDLDITNKGKERLAGRAGVKVLCEEYGVSHHIVLDALNIHDVNGTLAKHSGEGCGILVETRWKERPSAFDSLTIENCIIRRCERNGITWSSGWDRRKWFPNTHTMICKNLIEEVPGDGIVPIGCDGALVEYNLMRNCTDLLPEKDAAAGIWPWSSDNTLIQYNEVSHHKASWDGQGFDSDFNCSNTTIQYNYSHDNEGGFILICCPGPSECDTTGIVGNRGTIVQYNISINDGLRTRKTHIGMYSPIIHIGGTATDTRVNNNILHANTRPNKQVDCSMITSDSWGGYSYQTLFKENVFYSSDASAFRFSHSTEDSFEGNYYLGTFSGMPDDKTGKTISPFYEQLLKKDSRGFQALVPFMKKVEIANGEAEVTVVDKQAIEHFFNEMRK